MICYFCMYLSYLSHTMKTNRLGYFPIFFVLTLLISCQKEVLPNLILPQTSISFSAEGGSEKIDFIANKSWMASSSESWCKVSPAVGVSADMDASFSVSITCEPNESYDTREAVITITVGTLSQNVNISQNPSIGIEPGSNTYTVSCSAQSLNIPVEANCDYTVSIPSYCQSWVKVISTKALSKKTITFEISENKSYDPRNAVISLVNERSGVSSSFTIIQEQSKDIQPTKDRYEVSYLEQSINISVKSNVNYSVFIDGSCQDWIEYKETKGLSSSTVVVHVLENTSIQKREGTVWLVDDESGINRKITVVQNEAEFIEVSSDLIELSYSEQTFPITIHTNVGVEAIVSSDATAWLSIKSSISASDIELSCMVSKNSSHGRTGTIIVTSLDKTITKEITVRQEGPVVFTDNNFKAYCLASFDKDRDGEISSAEARSVYSIEIYTDNIKSIDGINAFCNLENLVAIGSGARNYNGNVFGNYSSLPNPDQIEKYTSVATGSISEIHISELKKLRNLQIDANNSVEQIDLVNCESLVTLSCTFCNIKSLDLSGCTALQTVKCSCNQLSELTISALKGLEVLQCYDNVLENLFIESNISLNKLNFSNNKIASINLSNNTRLAELCCNSNKLSSLDVKNNKLLQDMQCSNNSLYSLDLSNNTVLRTLWCINNNLSSLDISHNTLLEDLFCPSNQLTSIDLQSNHKLRRITIYSNKLTKLDVSNNPALTELWVGSNQLYDLDVSNCSKLQILSCNSNQISHLDVNKNIILQDLYCDNNQLTTLDVHENLYLQNLGISDNYLTNIDLSKNTKLVILSCDNNSLTELELTNNPDLQSLYCSGNLLTFLDITHNLSIDFLMCSPMNDISGHNLLKYLYISKGHNINGITVNRSSFYIPYLTQIIVK